jgi:uncharacterized protein (TIGR03545 family)
MIRWRYILPRVLIVVAIIFTLRYVLSPLVQYVTTKSLQAATGLDLQLAGVDVEVFPLRLHYADIQVADPGTISRNGESVKIASATAVQVTLDSAALLHRRYVVKDARVSGLQFDATGRFRGSEEAVEQPSLSRSSAAVRWLSDLLSSTAENAKSEHDALAASSETLRRGDQIRRRWKMEYESLARRAAELEVAIKEVQQTAQGVDNPLRDWPRVDKTLNRTKEIQQELATVRKALDSLPADSRADLLTLDRARQEDIERIRQLRPLDLTAADTLGSELLTDQITKQIQQVRDYLDTGRQMSQWTPVESTARRQRGEVIDLSRKKQLPSFLIRRCEVSGVITADNRAYQLAGILENVTPQASLRNEPMRAKLKLQGEQTVRLEYVRDDQSQTAHEMLTIHWPEVEAVAVRLGSTDVMDLDLHQGRMELWVQIDVCGEEIAGRLVSRRTGVHIDSQVTPMIAETQMFHAFRNTVGNVDRVDVDADFKGSWNDLDLVVKTNLTGLFKTAVRDATARQTDVLRAQMESEVDRLYAGQVTFLQNWLAGQHSSTYELLAKADDAVQKVSRQVLSESSNADAYLGRLRGSRAGLQ